MKEGAGRVRTRELTGSAGLALLLLSAFSKDKNYHTRHTVIFVLPKRRKTDAAHADSRNPTNNVADDNDTLATLSLLLSSSNPAISRWGRLLDEQ